MMQKMREQRGEAMIAPRRSLSRSVSSSVVGLNSSIVIPASARSGQPWVSTGANSTHSRRPVRCFSAESLHVIPQTKDIESQFQAVLGKCLFEKAVQNVEEGDNGRVDIPRPPSSARTPSSESLGSSRPGSSYGSSGCNSPMIPGGRMLTIRPTRCASPLVKESRSFDSYINRGSVDGLAVAKTRGTMESPKPNIHRYLHRVRTVSEQELNQFSLKEEFTDKGPENEREQYWRRKKEEKILEEEVRERKRQEKEEMLVILNEMKKEYDERKAREAEEAERLRIQMEEERIAKEKEEELALLERLKNQSILDDASSVVSSSSKSSRKRSSKKGRSSKKDKTSKRGKSPSRKSGRKKSAVAPSTVEEASQGSGRDTPQPILKERRPSADTSQGKRVRFREKLVSTRTIRPHKPVSPRKGSPTKKSFPGSTSSEAFSPSPTPGEKKKKKKTPGSSKGRRGGSAKGSKKGSKKKALVEPAPPVEPPKEAESPVTAEPEPVEPVVEPVSEEVEPVIVDEPPEFCPAGEYKTRRQMVEEWLYYRSCSAHRQANPPIL